MARLLRHAQDYFCREASAPQRALADYEYSSSNGRYLRSPRTVSGDPSRIEQSITSVNVPVLATFSIMAR